MATAGGADYGAGVTEGELQTLRVAASLGAVAVAMLLQRVSPHARLRGSWRVNGGLWVANVLVMGAVCGACAFTTAEWAARGGIGILGRVHAPPLLAMLSTIAGLDLVAYWWHRANHRIPALWRFHRVHHSDSTFTVSTGVRFHPGELLLALPVRLAAIVALGAPPEAVLAFEVVFTAANLVEHGDIAWPRRVEHAAERVLVTSALHRRHHGRGLERNANFGTIFSVWDRVLGTYLQNESGARVDTGLPGLDRVTLAGALALPVRR
jgi:sterol desaturase/sphingolipid hydroxylase (fatty acid hydroxylase superfamily)